MLRVEHTAKTRQLRYLLRRGWRVMAAAIAFTCFGLGGGAFGLLAAPVLQVGYRDPVRREHAARVAIGALMRVFAWLMRVLGLIDVRVENAALLQRGGVVIAPNHPTLIDVVLLLAIAPQLDCVVKSALFRNPFTRGPVRAAGYIANVEGPELIGRCAERVRAGRSLLVFPEGTRTVAGTSPRCLRGASSIAVVAKAELLPVVIRCTPAALSKQHHWYDLPAGPLQFDIEVRTALVAPSAASAVANPAVHGERAGADPRARAARELTAALNRLYAEALGFTAKTPEVTTAAVALPGS